MNQFPPLQEGEAIYVEHQIRQYWPDEQLPAQLAESLVAIGLDLDVPFTALTQFVQHQRPDLFAWRRECERYVEARRRILEAGKEIL